MQIGKYTLEGGGACPEQYDVLLGEQVVGYLRLRHGRFRADCYPAGDHSAKQTVFTAAPEGDGCFDSDEREKFLTEAVNAIDAYLNKPV